LVTVARVPDTLGHWRLPRDRARVAELGSTKIAGRGDNDMPSRSERIQCMANGT